MDNIDIYKKVDFNSPVPFYIQIIDSIRSVIKQQSLKPGDLLPGESDFCEYFSVSRTVVRQALDDLYHEGLIVRKKGKGTFVCEPKILERFGQQISGFYHEMTSRGYQFKTEVLQQEIVFANKEFAEYLQKNIGDPLIAIKRLRFLNDEPILIVTSLVPFDKCKNLLKEDLSKISLYEFIEKNTGCKLSYGQRSIEATLADAEQAKLLIIRKGDPLLLINSIVYLEDGTPIEYHRSHYRGDRYRFKVELINIREERISNQFLIDENKPFPSSEGVYKDPNE